MHWPFSVCERTVKWRGLRGQVKHVAMKVRPKFRTLDSQLCLEMGLLLIPFLETEVFQISSSLLFMQGIPIFVNSYVTTYLPITLDNKTQQRLPLNQLIECG